MIADFDYLAVDEVALDTIGHPPFSACSGPQRPAIGGTTDELLLQQKQEFARAANFKIGKQ
jgi:hypothetical protein